MADKTLSVLEKSICFAVKAHSGQKRKLSGSPYILHPLEAAQIAASITSDEEVLAAVVLHDTIEDCGVSLEELRREFGDRVADLVASESEDKMRDIPPEESWQKRKEITLEQLKNCSDKAVKIMWLSDKLSNMRSFDVGYQTMGDGIWNSFNQKDKLRHEWYYRTVLANIPELSETPAYKELKERTDKVFGSSDK
ncbi:MAG: bifunctional (p)ppGpp synthetase/guanosine-3',5'-bis(diphosphate) 3'-pyrophosphohydrolase [Clostridia bacterium]|nr:bifunctional (p)ppGpp synthetase/guanosine-3',5'-bis(diphosphate) 3'-pyrophosphohydrolase [Clostridia bacterium]